MAIYDPNSNQHSDGNDTEAQMQAATKCIEVNFDTKVTVWTRQTVLIDVPENATQEEILQLAKDAKEDSGAEFEILYDTEETLTPGDNGGQPTEEILIEGETVWTN